MHKSIHNKLAAIVFTIRHWFMFYGLVPIVKGHIIPIVMCDMHREVI